MSDCNLNVTLSAFGYPHDIHPIGTDLFFKDDLIKGDYLIVILAPHLQPLRFSNDFFGFQVKQRLLVSLAF